MDSCSSIDRSSLQDLVLFQDFSSSQLHLVLSWVRNFTTMAESKTLKSRLSLESSSGMMTPENSYPKARSSCSHRHRTPCLFLPTSMVKEPGQQSILNFSCLICPSPSWVSSKVRSTKSAMLPLFSSRINQALVQDNHPNSEELIARS